MTESPLPGGAWVGALDQAGWTMVSERVIQGICHDLNGRANSLFSIAYLLSSGGGPWSRVGSGVEEELVKLSETVRLLRLLGPASPGPRLLSPAEILRQVSALVSLQPGLEGVQIELVLPSGAPAVYMDETVLFRSLLLLLSASTEEALRVGTGRVRVVGSEEDGGLCIEPGGWGGCDGLREERAVLEGGLPPDLERRVGLVLQQVGGGLERGTGPAGKGAWEVGLPRPS